MSLQRPSEISRTLKQSPSEAQENSSSLQALSLDNDAIDIQQPPLEIPDRNVAVQIPLEVLWRLLSLHPSLSNGEMDSNLQLSTGGAEASAHVQSFAQSVSVPREDPTLVPPSEAVGTEAVSGGPSSAAVSQTPPPECSVPSPSGGPFKVSSR